MVPTHTNHAIIRLHMQIHMQITDTGKITKTQKHKQCQAGIIRTLAGVGAFEAEGGMGGRAGSLASLSS